jgi:hypothetical protein
MHRIFAAHGYDRSSDLQRVPTWPGIDVCAGGSLSQILQSMLLGLLISGLEGRQMGPLLFRLDTWGSAFVGWLLEASRVVLVIDNMVPAE